jgi:hypothetical protein
VRIPVLLFLALPLGAQQQQHPPAWPTSPANCAVDGQVLDSVKSVPVAGAVVTIYNLHAYRVDGTIATQGAGVRAPEQVPDENPQSVTSDDDGRFSFTGLEPGIYVMGAVKEAYLRSRYMTPDPAIGGSIRLEPGTAVHNLPIRLRPQSVLAGHIRAGGAPLAGARVSVGKFFMGQEGRALSMQASGVTNERGEYRITGLEPDEYYVRAEPHLRQPDPEGGALVSMVSFYPGAETIGDAHPVKLSEGQHLEDVDMTLPQRQGAGIRGTIASIDGATPYSVDATSKEFGTVAGSVGRTDDGHFTFEVDGLPPGAYWVHARATKAGRPYYNALAPVDLDWSGLSGIELRPAPSVDLHGHIESDGPLSTSLSRVAMYLDNSVGNSWIWIHLQDDGTFTLQGVPAAVYRITPQFTGHGYLRAVRMGGVDVTETGLDLTRGDPAGELELSFSTASGTIDGMVVDESGKPALDSFIALLPAVLPADPQRARGLSRFTVPTVRGNYGFIGIPPGSYFLVAAKQMTFDRNAVLYDPEYFKRFEAQGHAVQIGPNSKETIQLVQIR